jgi:hypothetical protein
VVRAALFISNASTSAAAADFTRPTGVWFVDTYLVAWWLFLAFEGIMELVSAAQILIGGVLPAQTFFMPMTHSGSLRDFWSQRWNYPAQKMLKRLAFDPAMAAGWPILASVAATYLLSVGFVTQALTQPRDVSAEIALWK